MKAQPLLEQTLRQNNHSVTQARNIVFAALENQEPMTMRELIEKTSMNIDRASIYRTVELFEKLGIINRISVGWKYKIELADAFHEHHHHITCVGCGALTPFHEPEKLAKTIENIAQNARYRPLSHQLELRGICETCQKNQDPGHLARV